jgi:xylulokinase
MKAMDWSSEILDALDLRRDQLGELARPGTVLGRVSAAAASETGLKAGTPIVAAGGDGQCAGTGTATLGGGRAYVNLGTAVVSGSYGDGYRHDPAFRTMTAVAEQGYIYETCLRTGTFLVDWMVRNLFGTDPGQAAGIFSALEREAEAVPIGACGLVTVPYWSGAMTPYWNTNARGILAGLSASHRRGHVYRSLLEGVALEQALMSDRVGAAGCEPVTHYVAIGGGAASSLWCQILADASGRPVHRSATVEASSLGAAMAAATGAGWYANVADAARAMSGTAVATFEPDPARRARYQELLGIYAELWPMVERWNDRLVRFADSQAAGL